MAKTTKQEFDLFKSECRKWLKLFGLLDWWVDFAHEKLDNRFAEIRREGLEDRNAVIVLNSEFTDDEYKYLDIKKSAFHEVMELFLYPLLYIGTCRYVQPEEFTAANHAIIRTLENVVFPILDGRSEDL